MSGGHRDKSESGGGPDPALGAQSPHSQWTGWFAHPQTHAEEPDLRDSASDGSAALDVSPVEVVLRGPDGRRYEQTFVRGDSSIRRPPQHEPADELIVDVEAPGFADVLMFERRLPPGDEPLVGGGFSEMGRPEPPALIERLPDGQDKTPSQLGALISLRPADLEATQVGVSPPEMFRDETEVARKPLAPPPRPSADGADPPMVGAVGLYAPIGRIGASSDSEVILAYAVDLGDSITPVAIRRLLPRDGPDWQGRCARFLADGQIGMSLRHRHLVAVTDYGVDEGIPFIVRELIDGINIRAIKDAAQVRVSPRLVATVGWQVARALEYAHTTRSDTGASLGLVHQEICPTAIFVRSDGLVKLTEVGVTRLPGGEILRSANGGRRGLMGYATPEQLRSQPIDARADLFSLGIVLVELLSQRPLLADGGFSLRDLPGEVDARCRAGAGVPSSLAELLTSMTSLALRERPATTKEVVRGFERSLADLGGPARLDVELGPIFAAKGIKASAPPAPRAARRSEGIAAPRAVAPDVRALSTTGAANSGRASSTDLACTARSPSIARVDRTTKRESAPLAEAVDEAPPSHVRVSLKTWRLLWMTILCLLMTVCTLTVILVLRG